MESKIGIWLASIPAVSQEDEKRCQSWLSEVEREKLMQYRSVQARRGYLYNHLLLRHVRRKLCGVSSHDGWSVQYDNQGRLVVLCGMGGYAISLSRCHDRVVCAVSEFGGLIGVDIESVQRNDLDVNALASVVMQPQEREEWLCHAEYRQIGFLSNWCGKEAYAKALGIGLIRPPAEYSLQLLRLESPESQAFTICDPMLPASKNWTTLLTMVGGRHILSCVCEYGRPGRPEYVDTERLLSES